MSAGPGRLTRSLRVTLAGMAAVTVMFAFLAWRRHWIADDVDVAAGAGGLTGATAATIAAARRSAARPW